MGNLSKKIALPTKLNSFVASKRFFTLLHQCFPEFRERSQKLVWKRVEYLSLVTKSWKESWPHHHKKTGVAYGVGHPFWYFYNLVTVVWFLCYKAILYYLISVHFTSYTTKAKRVIPFTCRAFKLILKASNWVSLTSSNCPSLQALWNGIFIAYVS